MSLFSHKSFNFQRMIVRRQSAITMKIYNPSTRTALSFMIIGTASSVMPSPSKSLIHRSGVMRGGVPLCFSSRGKGQGSLEYSVGVEGQG